METNLVALILKESMDAASDLESLVRKLKTLGRQLSNKDLENWAQRELSGYEKEDELPPYRLLHTESVGRSEPTLMSSWTHDNRNLVKTFFVMVDRPDYHSPPRVVDIHVELDTQTWRWTASIYMQNKDVVSEAGEERPKLTGRTPERAAARAVEFVLSLADRGEIDW